MCKKKRKRIRVAKEGFFLQFSLDFFFSLFASSEKSVCQHGICDFTCIFFSLFFCLSSLNHLSLGVVWSEAGSEKVFSFFHRFIDRNLIKLTYNNSILACNSICAGKNTYFDSNSDFGFTIFRSIIHFFTFQFLAASLRTPFSAFRLNASVWVRRLPIQAFFLYVCVASVCACEVLCACLRCARLCVGAWHNAVCVQHTKCPLHKHQNVR